MIRALLVALAFAAHSVALAERPLPEVYREAKAALEADDAARCAELLAPALKNAGDEPVAPAQLALGLAWLRLEQPHAAAAVLEKAAAAFEGTPQAPNALAPLGDAFRLAGDLNKASEAYLRAAKFADTINGRYASARLHEIDGVHRQNAGEYAAAANSYLQAADTLLVLGKDDQAYLADARALFEKLARGTGKPPKEDWRGEPTARAVFGLGEVERISGHFPEAIAYYQRTFVSWVRYPQWAARAYLRAAECMDRLGKRDFAIRHLRELVRKVEKYGKLPEYQEAKRQLRAWGEDIR